uniref:Cytochrome P450 n=1 Tax=Propithecus coquereli TaxID=379532 RepID=A0A2K6GYA4_PROCO
IILIAWKRTNKGGKLPPGPTPIPFLGNLPQVRTDATFQSFLKVSPLTQDMAFSNGQRTKQLQHYCMTTLRDFSMGKRGIEECIQEEVGFLTEKFRGTRGAIIDPTFFLSRTVSNVISSVVFGDRFDYENKELLSLLRMMKGSLAFTATSTGQLYEMFYSVMKHLPGPQQQAFRELQGLDDFIAKKVVHNQHTLDPNYPRDFIDSFLIRMQEEQKNPNMAFCMKNLVLTTLNLFLAGTETFSMTLRCGILLLMKHPDVEAKVHEEIYQVIGKNRHPRFEDRAKMSYTKAVIHEIERFGDLSPMGLAHRFTKFQDFFLPKGNEVFPMLGSVLADSKFFSKPRDFAPQHFMDEKGQFKKSDAFVPFSIGKRCRPLLTPTGLFLFLITIMQNFRFKSLQSPEDIDVSPKHVGLTRIPPYYTMSFLPR